MTTYEIYRKTSDSTSIHNRSNNPHSRGYEEYPDRELYWRDKVTVLESRIQTLFTENESYSKKLRDSVEQRVALETNHRTLKKEFDALKATIEEVMTPNRRLQLDMEELAEKLMKEGERRCELEHAKQLVEAELEDLTKNLFEEANKMVAIERESMANLKKENAELKALYKESKVNAAFYKDQCAELKIRLNDASSPTKLRRSSLTSTGTPSSTNSGILGANRSFLSGETAVMGNSLSFSVDDYRFVEFQEFLDAPSIQGTNLNSNFAKRTISEDIEPALRFQATGFFFYKRLMTGAQLGTINIYIAKSPTHNKNNFKSISSSSGVSSKWRTFSISSDMIPESDPNLTCSLCNATVAKHHPHYLYTLQEGDTVTKVACSSCRTRLVSAVQLFTLLRHIRDGLVPGTPQKLYLAVLRSKLSLFLARTGSYSDDPFSSTSTTPPSSTTTHHWSHPSKDLPTTTPSPPHLLTHLPPHHPLVSSPSTDQPHHRTSYLPRLSTQSLMTSMKSMNPSFPLSC